MSTNSGKIIQAEDVERGEKDACYTIGHQKIYMQNPHQTN
jgi:hypothetical protein